MMDTKIGLLVNLTSQMDLLDVHLWKDNFGVSGVSGERTVVRFQPMVKPYSLFVMFVNATAQNLKSVAIKNKLHVCLLPLFALRCELAALWLFEIKSAILHRILFLKKINAQRPDLILKLITHNTSLIHHIILDYTFSCTTHFILIIHNTSDTEILTEAFQHFSPKIPHNTSALGVDLENSLWAFSFIKPLGKKPVGNKSYAYKYNLIKGAWWVREPI